MSNVPTEVVMKGGYLLWCGFTYVRITRPEITPLLEIADPARGSVRHGAIPWEAILTLPPCRVNTSSTWSEHGVGSRGTPYPRGV